MQTDVRNERIREAKRAVTGTKHKPRIDESPVGVLTQEAAPAQAPAPAPIQPRSALPLPPALPAKSPAPQVIEMIPTDAMNLSVSNQMIVDPFDEPEVSAPPTAKHTAAVQPTVVDMSADDDW